MTMKVLTKIKADIKQQVDHLSAEGFRQIFDRIDQLSVKRGVDNLGLEKFIDQCAWMAVGTGAISGAGGFVVMLVSMPLDIVNLIMQQFRITMAIMYHRQGHYKVGFEEFMALVAQSLKIEAGVTVTKTVMEAVAEKIMLKLGARAARKLVPVVGAVIGGAANYLYIKRMAESVKEIYPVGQVIKVN